MGDTPVVQSMARVLQVLEALNEHEVTGVDRLHRVTGLPKATIVRILNTLVEVGYAFQVSRRDGYALTERVLRLSAGFRYKDAVVTAARPLLEAFTRRHKWQISLATLDGTAMRVRFNTRKISPFAPDQMWLNRRVGMTTSALGRAYLAFCSATERALLIEAIRADPTQRRASPQDLQTLIAAVRERGYATIERDAHDRVRSFAVPVLTEDGAGTAIAALSMFYFASTMSEELATRRYLEEMYEIGHRIADALA